MPFGIRPSNVRVCHSTTRALGDQRQKLPQPDACGKYLPDVLTRAPARDRSRSFNDRSALRMRCRMESRQFAINVSSTSTSMSKEGDWIKVDLHIHTLDDPKDAVAYSAHQLLERAR